MDDKIYNASFTYNTSKDIFQIQSGLESGYVNVSYDWYRDTWQPARRKHIQTHRLLITDRTKFEKAFKIAKTLIGRRLMTTNKLRDVMIAVDSIADVL